MMETGKAGFDENFAAGQLDLDPRQTTEGATGPAGIGAKLATSTGRITPEAKAQQMNQAKLMANATVGVSPGLKRR